MGLLRALDPFSAHDASVDKESKNSSLPLDDSVGEERKERKGFWGAAREKDRDKERERDKVKERRDDDGQAELTRMIGAYFESPAESVIETL